MKIVPSLRYQLRDQRNAILVYYGVLLSLIVLTLLFIPFSGESNLRITTEGVTAITMIFFFICSLCAFKDNLRFNLQHGASRKTQFLARMGAMGILCAVLAVLDELYTLLLNVLHFLMPKFFNDAGSLMSYLYARQITERYQGIYGYYPGSQPTPNSVLIPFCLEIIFSAIVFSFFFLLVASSFAYLIAVFNYRLNKIGKIIFWVSWPFLFTALSAFLDANPLLANSLVPVITQVSRVTISTLPRFCITCTVLTLLFSALTWPLMRRANIK